MGFIAAKVQQLHNHVHEGIIAMETVLSHTHAPEVNTEVARRNFRWHQNANNVLLVHIVQKAVLIQHLVHREHTILILVPSLGMNVFVVLKVFHAHIKANMKLPIHVKQVTTALQEPVWLRLILVKPEITQT
jgi:hypothetical protein